MLDSGTTRQPVSGKRKTGEYLSYLAAEREMFSKVPGLEIETEISRFDVPLA